MNGPPAPSSELITHPEENTVAIIVIPERPTEGVYEDLPRTQELLLHINAVSQQAVALGKTLADLSGTTYVLRFKPELAQGIAAGELRMMNASGGGIRANVVDKSHTIRGQASLHEMARLGTAVLAVWQALALITAQKFLADIGRQLADIESSVRDIQRWLENDRRAQLRRGLTRIHEIGQAVGGGSLPAAEMMALRLQLDGIDRDASVAIEALSAPDGELARLQQRLESQVLNDRHIEKNAAAAIQHIDDFTSRSTDLLLAAICRTGAVQMRYAMSGSFEAELPILENVERILWTHAEAVGRFHSTARLRCLDLAGSLSLESTDKAHRARLHQHIEALLPDASEKTIELLRRVREAAAMLRLDKEEAASGVALLVTRSTDGSIERVRRPSRASAIAAARDVEAFLLEELERRYPFVAWLRRLAYGPPQGHT